MNRNRVHSLGKLVPTFQTFISSSLWFKDLIHFSFAIYKFWIRSFLKMIMGTLRCTELLALQICLFKRSFARVAKSQVGHGSGSHELLGQGREFYDASGPNFDELCCMCSQGGNTWIWMFCREWLSRGGSDRFSDGLRMSIDCIETFFPSHGSKCDNRGGLWCRILRDTSGTGNASTCQLCASQLCGYPSYFSELLCTCTLQTHICMAN